MDSVAYLVSPYLQRPQSCTLVFLSLFMLPNLRTIIFFTCMLGSATLSAQQLDQVTFSGGSNLTYFSFLTEHGAHIRISVDGKVLEWGVESKSLRGEYYAPKLQPFPGRVDFYGQEADSISKGKVRMIGTCTITYYGPFEDAERVGKVRSIGTVFLDYFTQYENKVLKGKLKYIGSQMLEYYSAFENEAYRGKLRSIGGNQITYYSAFDDRMNLGKIKSIGPIKYAWFSTYDRKDMGGALKTGYYRQRINGVTYILW